MPVEVALLGTSVWIVGAHPDDETASAGGLLASLRTPHILTVTDGAPRNPMDAAAAGYQTREDYAAARRRELLNSMEVAGVAENQLHSLDVADQEASLAMADLARRIAAILRQSRPGALLTHAYEGGHPDHDAVAFAVHAACALVPIPPDIFEFASYHAEGESGAMIVGHFLSGGDPGELLVLSEQARQRKSRMMQCFSSQLHMLRHFSIYEERFRSAPAYDFTQAPHAGRLLYEQFDWGMTGSRWRSLATSAMQELGVSGVL